MPDNGAYFTYRIMHSNSTLQLSCKYGRNKAIFFTNEYALLKEFYSKAIEKMSEPIILKQN